MIRIDPGRRAVLGGLAGAAAGLIGSPARAQHSDEFNNKMFRIVVPFPAGMGSDNIARVVAQSLTELTGSNVIVENKPGGNNVIAVNYLNSLKPDGLAWFLASQSPTAVNAVLYKSLGYDPVKDLKPVALMLRSKWVVVGSGTSPYKSFTQFAEAARASDSVVTGSGGSSGYQLGMYLVGNAAKMKMNVVPYSGTPQALNDVIGGQVQLSVVDVGTATPQIMSGRLRALVIIGSERHPRFPDVPCSAEIKLDVPSLSSWNGIFTTRDTPYEVRVRLAALVKQVVASGKMAEFLNVQGAQGEYAGVDEMEKMQMEQIETYRTAMRIGKVELQ